MIAVITMVPVIPVAPRRRHTPLTSSGRRGSPPWRLSVATRGCRPAAAAATPRRPTVRMRTERAFRTELPGLSG